MRVSLTADPIEEVGFAIDILKTLGLRKSAIDIVSCPTCGRTRIDLEKLAIQVENRLKPLEKELEKNKKDGIKIAVMGCAVLSLIHISEPTRQAEISYAVFCLKKKKKKLI